MSAGFYIQKGGPKSPCSPDCPERNAECHAHCPKWLPYEKAINAWRKKRLEDGYGVVRVNWKASMRGKR